MRFDVNNSQGTPMQDAVQMSLGEVHAAAEAALLGQGFNRAHAAAIANTVTAAEQDECRHHGLFRLPFYMNGLHSGQASPDAEPTIKELAPGIMKVDAKYGFSPLALERGDEPLAAKAREHGIAALAVRFSYVFAMARRCPRGGLSDLTVSPPRIRLRRLRVRNFLSVDSRDPISR